MRPTFANMRAALAAFVLSAGMSLAQEPVEVDLELVLAVDVSRSMSPMELEIQRRGYAEALGSDEVLRAIQSGFLGRIAIAYVEWAGAGNQRIVVDWTLIETAEDARAVSDAVAFSGVQSMRRTSISEALLFSAEMFEQSPFTSFRQVIDVSGDGPNNQGVIVTSARDQVLERGITINGLPLMTQDGVGPGWNIENLDLYYAACVIGGPGAFVVPVYDWAQFAQAVRRKLVLEISGLAAQGLVQAQAAESDDYDCLIGERMWRRTRGLDLP